MPCAGYVWFCVMYAFLGVLVTALMMRFPPWASRAPPGQLGPRCGCRHSTARGSAAAMTRAHNAQRQGCAGPGACAQRLACDACSGLVCCWHVHLPTALPACTCRRP